MWGGDGRFDRQLILSWNLWDSAPLSEFYSGGRHPSTSTRKAVESRILSFYYTPTKWGYVENLSKLVSLKIKLTYYTYVDISLGIGIFNTMLKYHWKSNEAQPSIPIGCNETRHSILILERKKYLQPLCSDLVKLVCHLYDDCIHFYNKTPEKVQNLSEKSSNLMSKNTIEKSFYKINVYRLYERIVYLQLLNVVMICNIQWVAVLNNLCDDFKCKLINYYERFMYLFGLLRSDV